MKQSTSRRAFIKNTGKATLATGIGMTILPSFSSAKNQSTLNGFMQQPLPYAYSALEPIIDTLTMQIHYTKHAATYTKNLADACIAEKFDTNKNSLEDLLKNISKYSAKMRNNGGGHYNHELFWQCMKMSAETTSKPSVKLASAIDNSFGSFEAFKTQFSDAGKNRFGSGWVWLYIGTDKKLAIGSTPNQDNPLMDICDIKGTPILCLDIWEHAYYLKYQNKRADYINNWWNLVNWEFVSSNFA